MNTQTADDKGKSKFLVLTAQELDALDEVKTIRDYIKLDRIKFIVGPDGQFARVPVLEECRALCDLDNFDVMYDLTMQYLTGKELTVTIINDDDSETVLGFTRINNKNDDLRVMQCVADYPWIVHWLVEFVAGYLAKKFPLPTETAAQAQAAKTKKEKKAERSSTS